MKFFFRSVLTEEEVDASIVSNHANEIGASAAAPETVASAMPDGMIPASALPSAGHILADLFPDFDPAADSEHEQQAELEAQAAELERHSVDATNALGSATDTRETPNDNTLADTNEIQDEVMEGGAALPEAQDFVTDALEPDEPAKSDSAPEPNDAGDKTELEDVTSLELGELIEREVAAANRANSSAVAQPAGLPDSDPALDLRLESAEPIPLDPSFMNLDPAPEITEILSIDFAERAVDRATKDEVSPLAVSAGSADISEDASAQSDPGSAPTMPAAAARDWALEERLACHKEWVESQGVSGSKANLACMKLENAELIGVNLRYADLQDSNLKSADLLLADLRDACLVRANLQEACLVGANLEGANLERATLDTAMGLVPRQLAGANLHGAALPSEVSEFEAQPGFARASQMAARFFIAAMAISAISSLMIWKTKDLQLLADSSILPFLRSPAAAAALPTAQIYLIAPVVLFIVYLVFHFHLQNLWDAVLQLPAVFPDGRELGQNESRIVRGLLRAHFRWMNRDQLSMDSIERGMALLLAYWVAPLTLLLFWVRYLTLQDVHGTMLHLLLVVAASGVALYSTTKVGRLQERWSTDAKRSWQWLRMLREVSPLKVVVGFGVLLVFLAIGTMKGAPHDNARAPQFSTASIRRWAPTFFWSLGYDPYADLTEASISKRPANWNGGDEQIATVTGAKLSNTKFRYAQAYSVFLVNAHLWRSNFDGAFLSDADLRGADLSQATLRYAVMDGARLYHANLDRGTLDGANLNRADFRDANLSYCSMEDAILIDAQFQRASLYGARLSGSSMERANLEKTDLRSAHLDNANLDHAGMQEAYLWSAKLSGAVLRNALLASTIFIDADLQNADLRGAQFSGTVLNGANLAGAKVDGTDLRAAFGLTPAQVCSTASRNGAILTDALAVQVQSMCGGPLLAAPANASATATPAATQVPAQHPTAQALSQKSAVPDTPAKAAIASTSPAAKRPTPQ